MGNGLGVLIVAIGSAITRHKYLNRFDEETFALMTGLAGSLSTVSTWVSELRLAKFPSVQARIAYGVGTVVLGILILYPVMSTIDENEIWI